MLCAIPDRTVTITADPSRRYWLNLGVTPIHPSVSSSRKSAWSMSGTIQASFIYYPVRLLCLKSKTSVKPDLHLFQFDLCGIKVFCHLWHSLLPALIIPRTDCWKLTLGTPTKKIGLPLHPLSVGSPTWDLCIRDFSPGKCGLKAGRGLSTSI